MSLESKANLLKQGIRCEDLTIYANEMQRHANHAIESVDGDVDANEALKMFQKWNNSQEKFWFWLFETLKDEQ